MKQATAIDRINNEYEYACKHFKPFTNKYNGYAVILQELDDLWLAIKEDHESYLVKQGATKVAAMALRFLTDYCE
jgi:hypothetical protein